MKIRRLSGLHAQPGRWTRIILALLPLLLLVALYAVASQIRLADNPHDKLMPGFGKMADAFWRLATEPDRRSGEILLWMDTLASLSRLGIGMALSAVLGLLIGLNTALFPTLRAALNPLLTVLSIIPPLTLLPILFIVFGVGEEAKVMLIFIGTVFVISRDIHLATRAIPHEQIIKALTLGATQLGVVYRVVLPQIMPRLINTTRLTLGAAWLFLIAAEAVASTDGLGYRIYLVRRYLAMDVIIPYVAWITLLGFTMDWLLRLTVRWVYPWHDRDA
ncbi:ABC transporter permease [Magnetofaba australis]|uniref:Putative nitrate/sulfonate/bicarbonate ABC transporter permease n=1 Tax=Magnetofaba australis IT-1 TaxID=1434232 RepID=A0A1Y2K0U3_9PROT|nr:ABC transporter permease [Magnetofaba australis]OSM01592.1 putative nitrate/sulfonate/bicarbonate ABC transporter permease [Magnetofaba australis IT-1]